LRPIAKADNTSQAKRRHPTYYTKGDPNDEQDASI
jgi:hypothetical protein